MSDLRMDVARNIRQARAARNLTEVAVAEAAGLSRAGYRNLEAGSVEARAATLTQVARALGVTTGDLMRPAAPPIRVRFRSLKRLQARAHLLSDVARRLSDYEELESLLGDRLPFGLDGVTIPGPDTPHRTRVAAEVVRDRLGLRPDEPIRDICGLLESAGIKILRLRVASDAFFGLSVADGDGGPAIVVNTWDRISVERWIFTAAHELGHLVLHASDFDSDEATESMAAESEANLFAAHFLMPDAAFQSEWADAAGLALWDRVIKVKRMFGVSYRTVLYRLQEQGAPGVWMRFQVEAKRRWGRTLLRDDEPAALPGDVFRASAPEAKRSMEPTDLAEHDFIDDRRYRLAREALEGGHITVSRAGEILGKSLPEMRELMAAWV